EQCHRRPRRDPHPWSMFRQMVLLSHNPAFSKEPPVHAVVARLVLPGGYRVHADLERRTRLFASSPRPLWCFLVDGVQYLASGLATRFFLDQTHNTAHRSPHPSIRYLSPLLQGEATPSVPQGVAATPQYPLDHDR